MPSGVAWNFITEYEAAILSNRSGSQETLVTQRLKELWSCSKCVVIAVGGMCPTVGIVGYALGGGHGPLNRMYGLGSDSILALTLVTAKAEVTPRPHSHLRTSRTRNTRRAARGTRCTRHAARNSSTQQQHVTAKRNSQRATRKMQQAVSASENANLFWAPRGGRQSIKQSGNQAGKH